MSNPTPIEREKRGDISYPFINLLVPDSLEDSGDVVIHFEGERYAAHEYTLSAASPVFKTMLSNGMQESRTKEVHLKNIGKKS